MKTAERPLRTRLFCPVPFARTVIVELKLILVDLSFTGAGLQAGQRGWRSQLWLAAVPHRQREAAGTRRRQEGPAALVRGVCSLLRESRGPWSSRHLSKPFDVLLPAPPDEGGRRRAVHSRNISYPAALQCASTMKWPPPRFSLDAGVVNAVGARGAHSHRQADEVRVTDGVATMARPL